MTNPYFCKMCGGKISIWDQRNRIFCDDACKNRDYDLRKGRIPPITVPELKQLVGRTEHKV